MINCVSSEKRRQVIKRMRKIENLAVKIELFHCDSLNADITENTCIARQRQIEKVKSMAGGYDFSHWGHSGAFDHMEGYAGCVNCKIGKKLYNYSMPEEKQKTCRKCGGKIYGTKMCPSCQHEILKKRNCRNNVDVFLGYRQEVPA